MKRTHPPALLLEQLALDELRGERRKALEQELGAETVAAAVAQLRADNAALAERFAPENLPSPTRLQQLAERARSSERSARMHRVDLVLQRLVLAGVVMLAVTSPMWLPGSGGDRALPADSAQGPALEPTRIKGGARLFAFRKRGARVDPLLPGATARAGDLLQLGYDAGGRAHGVLLSLDGRGVVTL
ncbi:MAG: hypothetical protein OXT09_18355, partial [Myxococcales bacterium]|nr:hypothetical protein [Myxococcales bacterium]